MRISNPLDEIRTLIDAEPGKRFRICEVARAYGLSPQILGLEFRRRYGMPPYEYVIKTRIESAKAKLANGHQSILDLSFDLGFCSQSHFTEVFRKRVGMTPHAYRTSMPA